MGIGVHYTKILLQYDSSFAFRDLIITESEYFWDTDPGAGNANTMLVFDGNFDDMLEAIFEDTLLGQIPMVCMYWVLEQKMKMEFGVSFRKHLLLKLKI